MNLETIRLEPVRGAAVLMKESHPLRALAC